MLSEFIYLRKALIRTLICFGIACVVALSISWGTLSFWGLALPWPSLHGKTIPTLFIEGVRSDLLPNHAALAATNPLDSFIVVVGLAAGFAALVALCFAAFELWRFMRAGLYPSERRGLAFFLLASAFLLASGALFAYRVLVPVMYSSLYGFTPAGVVALFDLREVIWQVVGMMLATAVSFLLPVVMVLLTVAGIMPARLWRRYARHAFLIVLLASAILTPDGSGISMVILALPICILYTAGYFASVRVSRTEAQRKQL